MILSAHTRSLWFCLELKVLNSIVLVADLSILAFGSAVCSLQQTLILKDRWLNVESGCLVPGIAGAGFATPTFWLLDPLAPAHLQHPRFANHPSLRLTPPFSRGSDSICSHLFIGAGLNH